MQDLKVSLVQTNQIWENKQENLAKYEQLLELIDSDLIVLPEMFHTGFSLNAKALSEEYDDSPGINWLKQMAEKKSAAFYTSLIIKEDNKFFNRGVFVYPDRTVIDYDKRKSFTLAGENELFQAGTKETIVSYNGWNIQLQICYDLRFPELVRNRIGNDNKPVYDIIIYVANWPEKRSTHWITLLKARAIENQCYVAGVNRVGVDGNKLIYSGDSVVFDSLGEQIIINQKTEKVETAHLSMDDLISSRELLPFLRDL